MKSFKILALSLLVATAGLSNQSEALNNLFLYNNYNDGYENVEITDNEILNYIHQEGTTINGTVNYFQNPSVTKDRVLNLLRSDSFIIDDICNAISNKTVNSEDNPKAGFLGTIQYYLHQSGCAYSDNDVRKAIRKLYY